MGRERRAKRVKESPPFPKEGSHRAGPVPPAVMQTLPKRVTMIGGTERTTGTQVMELTGEEEVTEEVQGKQEEEEEEEEEKTKAK